MEEVIKYVITYPDGSIIYNTDSGMRSLCISRFISGTGRTWKEFYRDNYRCKKVKVTYEFI